MSTSSSTLPIDAHQDLQGEKKQSVVEPWVLRAQPSDFDWIVDKNLLRDEGVFYGLSDTNEVPVEKTNAIRHFFQERIRVLEKTLAEYRTELELCKKECGEVGQKIVATRKNLDEVSISTVTQPHDFWRYALGASAYVAMLICHFWLIQSWLSTSNVASPQLVAFGIYLFGSLSLFNRGAQIYHSDLKLGSEPDRREIWKTYLEEWAIPFVVSVFIVFQGKDEHSIGDVVVFFMLVFCIFLFVGKAFLDTIVLLKTEYGKLISNQKARRLQGEQKRNMIKSIERLDLEFSKILQRETSLKSQVLEDEKMRAMLLEQLETNISLFLSEFGLAKAMRNSLNHRQLSNLISNRH
jgi:hypothetical protein